MMNTVHVSVDARRSHPAVRADVAACTVAGAADILYARECDRGHVNYDVEKIEFYRLPPYRGHRFTLQFAPRRGERPQAPTDCPVCDEAIRRTGQLYVVIGIGSRSYRVLANPYPYMPSALTIVAEEHRSQKWTLPPVEREAASGESTDASDALAADTAALAASMEEHAIIWNGVSAGASLPRHAHLQALRLPTGHGPLAVQQATERHAGRTGWYGLADEYPIMFHFAKGESDAAADATAKAMRAWHRTAGSAATGNLFATSRAGTTEMWYFPRNTCYPRAAGLDGALGALELCGSFVLSAEWELQALRDGRINVRMLYGALRAVGAEQSAYPATDSVPI